MPTMNRFLHSLAKKVSFFGCRGVLYIEYYESGGHDPCAMLSPSFMGKDIFYSYIKYLILLSVYYFTVLYREKSLKGTYCQMAKSDGVKLE